MHCFPRTWLVHATAILSLFSAAQLRAAGPAPVPTGPPGHKLAFHAAMPELHPNRARGLAIGRSFDAEPQVSINLFNGNLVVHEPIGQAYPIDDRLRLQLRLLYNSTVWDYRETSQGVESAPVAHTNAGLGFDVSLGRLIAPDDPANPSLRWLFLSPDGAPHLFYDTLHWDTPDLDDPNDDAFYTRDGTYLRLRRVGIDEVWVEKPDGSHLIFESVGGEWRLRRLGTLASNHGVDLTYGPGVITLSDSHGRTHRIVFTDDPTGTYLQRIDRVELAAFGGAVATYDFHYTTATVPRPCHDWRGGTITVPLLTGITDPLGHTRSFSHVTSGATCLDSGRLEEIELTTGGRYAFGYGSYPFPDFTCGTPTAPYWTDVVGVTSRDALEPDGTSIGAWAYQPAIGLSDGAASCQGQERITTVTTPVGDQTVHSFSVATQATTTGSPAEYGLPITRRAADATGTRFLSDQVFDCDVGGHNCVLMRSTYRAYAQDAACTAITADCLDTNRRLLSTRTVFHDDPTDTGAERHVDVFFSDFDGLGQYRVRTRSDNFGNRADETRTVDYNPTRGTYVPGAGTFTMVATTDPWMLTTRGHERHATSTEVVQEDLCFDANGLLTRSRKRAAATVGADDVVVTYDWLDGQIHLESWYGGDDQALSQTNNLCNLSLPLDPVYRIERTWSSGALAREQHLDVSGTPIPGGRTVDRVIDVATGRTAVSHDVAGLRTTFTHDLLGRLTREQPEPGHGARVDHEFRAPTGTSSWSSGPRHRTFRRPNGGGAALTTTIRWRDFFGRPAGRQELLPDGTATRTRLSHNALGWRTGESAPFVPGQSVVWTLHEDHDPFGRPRLIRAAEGSAHDTTFVHRGIRETVESRSAAYAYWDILETCYEDVVTTTRVRDRDGRLTRETDDRPRPLPGALRETTYDHDVLGRLRGETQVLTVNGTSRTETRAWTHDGRGFLLSRSTLRTGSPIEEILYADHDPRGRHRRVTRIGPHHPAPGATTLHTLDELGRVVLVADASSVPLKSFVYGTGNGLACTLPPGCTGGSEDPACTCDGQPDATIADARLGKLVQATRHNHRGLAHVTVTESHVYGGVGGRMSASILDVDPIANAPASMAKRYQTTWAYDALGEPATIGYPRCLTCATGEPIWNRSVDLWRLQGRLTGVTAQVDGTSQDWVTQIGYGPGGTVLELVHANGIREVQTSTAEHPTRPSHFSIDATGSSCNCVDDAFGPFSYDGEGALCGVGAQSYVDPPSEPLPASPLTGCAATMVFDAFGLFTGENTDTSCVSPDYYLYDAQDRLVDHLSLTARKLVQVAGLGWVWLQDPDNWTHTWSLYGAPEGRSPLRQVTDGYDGTWRASLDHLFGAGRLLGRELRRQGQTPTVPIIRHSHPMGVTETNPLGQPRTTLDFY